MRDQIRIIKRYLTYKNEIFHKKDMGYSISKEKGDKLMLLREEALIAKKEIENETKYIKKLIKSVK